MDIVAAVKAGNAAAAEWSRRDLVVRADSLEAWAALVERSQGELAVLSSFETGQSYADAYDFDIGRAISSLRQIARLLREAEEDHHRRLPGGLSGLITTWSEPVFQLARKLGPAIGGGGPAIIKPSSLASRAILRFIEISQEAGLPNGLINVVCGRGSSVGEALLAHPAIGTVAFTGSSEVGAVVRKLAAEHGKRLHMGLGGRNPVVVFGDLFSDSSAPEKNSVAIATITRLLFDSHHETAWRGSRMFVQEAAYAGFLQALKREVAQYLERSPLGPLPGARLTERFRAAVRQSEAEKGKPLFPAPVAQDELAPYASVDLTLCSTLQQEEVMGPFVSISSFKYPLDAVKHANNCPFGQVAYVFGQDHERALKFARKIEAGRVFVNSGPVRDLDVEAAPLKNSGVGGDGPRALLDFFSRPIHVHS